MLKRLTQQLAGKKSTYKTIKMIINKVNFRYGSEKALGWKKLRLPRKRKKGLKNRWGKDWKQFIKIKEIKTINQ